MIVLPYVFPHLTSFSSKNEVKKSEIFIWTMSLAIPPAKWKCSNDYSPLPDILPLWACTVKSDTGEQLTVLKCQAAPHAHINSSASSANKNKIIVSNCTKTVFLITVWLQVILGLHNHRHLLFKLTPSSAAVPNCCCSKGPAPYWSNPPFLIWHSGTQD